MDPLSDVLRGLQLSGALMFRAELQAPWCFAVPPTDEMLPLIAPDADRLVRFHIVVSGRCLATVDRERFWLGPRDVILLPSDDAHLMGSAADVPPVPVLSVLPTLPAVEGQLACLANRGSAEAMTMLCGFLAFDEPIFDPLISALPRVIVDRPEPSGSRSWFDAMVDYVIRGGDGGSASGWRAMQTRLVELMFIDVVRRHVASLPEGDTGWLAALRDPHIGRAVAELHADPGRAWTVAELAKRVGLSRSVLAERFRKATGLGAMQYLAAWRLQLAAGFMRRGELSIAQAAARVGYRSEAAFHRAFKRVVGEPPAAWRAHAETDARAKKPDSRAYR